MLWRKMFRDIKKAPMQFASIFLMAFLTLWLFAGITSQWYGIEQHLAQYNAQTQLADIWAFGDTFSERNVRDVLRLEGITAVQRRLRLSAQGSGAIEPQLTLYFLEDNAINLPYLLAGVPIDTSRHGYQCIWLDARFAEASNLCVNDLYTLTLHDITMKLRIAGLVYSPEHVYFKGNADLFPDYSKAGFGFCSIQTLPVELYPSGIVPWNEFLLRGTDMDPVRMEKKLDDAMGRKVTSLLDRDNVPGVSDLPSKLDMLKAIGNVFPLAFFLIAVLIIITTMSRMVTNQRTQIGTFKALGFTTRKIMAHYLSYGFVLSAAGALLGILVGVNTLPKLFFAPLQRSYSLPVWRAEIPDAIWLAVLFFVAVCTLATYLSVRSILSGCAAEILRPKVQAKMKHSLFEKLPFWHKLSFVVQWNLRDLSRSKVRSLMAVAGVAGSMMLLTCAFAIQDTLTDTQVWLYDEIQHYQTQLNLKPDTPFVRVDSLRNKVDGELLKTGRVDIRAGENREATSMTVLESSALYRLTDSARNRIVLLDGELALSRKLAESLGVQRGDMLQWRIQGAKDWTQSTASVIYHNPMSQGVAMLQSTFRRTGYQLTPTSIITPQSNIHNADQFVAGIFSKADLLEAWFVSMGTLFMMTALLMIAAVLLALSVLYNLGLLSYNEMERNLATLKVIGFTNGKIRTILFRQNVWLSVVGICAGYPVGRLLVRLITASMGAGRDILPYVSRQSVALSVLITAIVSLSTNLLFSQKIRHIDMVASLKGVE